MANCIEILHTDRKRTTIVLSAIYLVATAVIALGYSRFYVEVPLPNGSIGQLLDIMDYISNSCMMPLVAFLSSIFIGWVMKPSWILEDVGRILRTFKIKKNVEVTDNGKIII